MQPTTNLPISPDTLPWQIETYETSPRCKAKREEAADRQSPACPTSHAIVDDSIYEPILGLGDDEHDVRDVTFGLKNFKWVVTNRREYM